MAIQAAVIDTIREGARKGHWNFKKEEKKNELVQEKASPKDTPKITTAPSKPDNGKDIKGNEIRSFWNKVSEGFTNIFKFSKKKEEVKE